MASATECAPNPEFKVVEPPNVTTGANIEKFPALPKFKLEQTVVALACVTPVGKYKRLDSPIRTAIAKMTFRGNIVSSK